MLEDPRLAGELARAMPTIEAAMAPAEMEGVTEALAPLLAVFWLDERARLPAFWRAYGAALGDLPFCALEAGVAAYLAQPGAEHFPKPGPLRALCRHEAFTIAGRARSAMRALAERRDAA